MVVMVDALHSGYMKLLRGLLGNKKIIQGGLSVVIKKELPKLPDECGPCTIRNSSVAIKRSLLVKPELL